MEESSPVDIYHVIWRNGVNIRVLYYPQKLLGEVDEDRIQLIIGTEESIRGWLMTIQEANSIIIGLSKAMDVAIENNIKPYHEQND